jgi:putative ABC transport system permease protein
MFLCLNLAVILHALRMTRRDWRSGELRFLLLALVVAVAALSAVGFFADRMNRALQRDAAQLLGADLVVRSDYPVRDAWQRDAARRGLALADTVIFPTMATTSSSGQEDTRLVALKAVSSAYPLRGSLTLVRNGRSETVHGAPDAGTAWVDPSFLSARNLSVGEALKLGEKSFRIAAVIALEQDRGAGFMNFAPRVMIPLDDLQATGLLQPGSRITYRLQVAGDARELRAYRDWLDKEIKRDNVRGIQLESLEAGRPEMRATLDRARQFLALVGLLTAMLAALAIALAARRFMQRHLDGVAMLRCLGLTQRELTQIYLLEFLLVGLAGGVLGSLVGFGAHFLLLQWLGPLMQVELPAPGLLPLVQGIATGLLLLLGFALPPILQLRNVPHNRVIRREQGTPRPFTLAGYLCALACFVLLLVWQTGELKLGLLTAAGFLAALVSFSLLAWLVLRALRLTRAPLHWPSWRFAQDALRRRPAASVLQIVSLALGLMALLLLTIVRHDLLSAWQQSVPPDAPNHFMINIQPEQRAPVIQALQSGGLHDVRLDPMIRGRLVQVNGKPIGPESYAEERAQRLVEREFNVSTMPDLPAHNSVTEGHWFDASARNEASVEQGLAKTLNLKLGDQLRFDVGGMPIEVKVTSIRKLDWGSMRVNFFVILDPVSAAPLPSTWITAFYLPPSQQSLVNRLVHDFPNLTIVDVGSMVAQVQQVIGQVVSAVEFLFLFTLAAGVMVLSSALLVSQQERAHEAGLLRALGATRTQLSRAQWVECMLVGGSAGLLAASGASLVGWILARQVFDFEWIFRPQVWLAGLAIGILCALAGGWFGLNRVLSRPPILTLREG